MSLDAPQNHKSLPQLFVCVWGKGLRWKTNRILLYGDVDCIKLGFVPTVLRHEMHLKCKIILNMIFFIFTLFSDETL